MSIIVRKTGNREYAYVARRDGTRMIQTYIGPLARPEVRRRVAAAQWVTAIPAHTMRLFAGVDPADLHLQRNAGPIIACVLEDGPSALGERGVGPDAQLLDGVVRGARCILSAWRRRHAS
jgi:hypothetical protein